MNEVKKTLGSLAGAPSPPLRGNFTGQNYYPGPQIVRPSYPVRDQTTAPASPDLFDPNYSENGFSFVGEDSLGEVVKGFVQTSEAKLAEQVLERAGINVQSIHAKRGVRKKNRRPTGVEFATLAEQFGDLMEIGESPTQVCRLLAYAQTNNVLSEALLNAGELVINGRSLSEAFAAQLDQNGEPLFPITFICALR